MSIEILEATSKEMEKNKKIVGFATGGVMFGKGMDKVNWKLVRFICDFGYTFMPKDKGAKFKRIKLGGINAVLTMPKELTGDGIIMYIHGGGLVSGSAKATKAYCSMLANYSGLRVVTIDYRLAPEHKYPAAIDDCEEAFLELHKMFPSSKIALTGESAGAYLSCATTIRLIEKKEFMPGCILPQSVLCEFDGGLDRSYYEIIDRTVTSPEAITYLADVYAGKNADLTNPEISLKHYTNYKKFPPVFMSCDANECLRADSDHLYKLLEDAGADVRMVMFKNTFHACTTLGTGSPETLRVMKENIEFIKKHCCV